MPKHAPDFSNQISSTRNLGNTNVNINIASGASLAMRGHMPHS